MRFARCAGSLYGGSGIPVDIDMRPLHPCLIWMDRRATAEVDWVNANVNVERLRVITGNGVDSYYGFTKMPGCATSGRTCGRTCAISCRRTRT